MKYDLHVHSKYSPDCKTGIKSIVKTIKKNGLNGFAITDHDSTQSWDEALKESKKQGVDFIKAMEVTSKNGHILAYDINEPIEKSLSAEETVEKILEQDGIPVAAHPYSFLFLGVGDLVKKLDFQGIEVINGEHFLPRKNVTKIAEKLCIGKTGGSDAHSLGEIGNAYTLCVENVLEEIKKAKTVAGGKSRRERIMGFIRFNRLTRFSTAPRRARHKKTL